jgi:hypothetical protein
MRTFAQLRTEVLQWLDESAATSSSSSYLNVGYALKQAHTIRLTEDSWKFMLWPRWESFTTVAGQSSYSLHQEFHRPLIFKNTSRDVTLIETPSRNIENAGIDLIADTNTDRFQLWGRSPVLAQPTSASVIRIVSSSASDNTAAKAITITGDTASGVTSESITPNGTTPVSGTTSFTQILGVTKGAEWAGTLTMTSNSAAVTNLTLFPTEYGRSYPQLQYLGTPAAGETVQYRFYRKPRELANDNDLTDIPPPFERVLVFDALLLMGAYDNRLDGGRMALWTGMRNDLDFQLRQSQLEGQSLGAEGRFIGYRANQANLRMPD